MKMLSAGPVLLLLLALSPATYAAVCPATGHEYQVVSGLNITWADARTGAQALPGGGWDLASIGSADENACVVGMLSAGDRHHYWIGATDSASEGTWVWVDSTIWSYTNWGQNQPDSGSSENYLAYDYQSGSWVWNDAPNDLAGAGFQDYAKGYVAERVVPENSPSTAPIPTLSQWAMIVLFGLLAGATVFTLRRHHD